MTALALVSDLMMQSQIAGAGARAGVPVNTVGSTDALLAALDEQAPALVILDLSHPGLDPATVVGQIKSAAPRATVLAFVPHVHKELLAAAASAGCNRVLSRGQFHTEMAELLAELAR